MISISKKKVLKKSVKNTDGFLAVLKEKITTSLFRIASMANGHQFPF
jgi:hypothetical protein